MTPGTLTRDLELHLSVNPSSPLFARLAEALLRNGEISRAEHLCEKGLELYPNYHTARLLQARCLAARGQYETALGSLGGVAARYPGNIVLGELEEEWRDLAAARAEPVPDDAAVFTDMPVAGVPEPETPAVEISVEYPVEYPVEIPGATPPEPAPEIGSVTRGEPGNGIDGTAPVPSIDEKPVPLLQPVPASWMPDGFIGTDRIVSRTLAEIYASQGAIGEAVETYRILLDRMPERREMLEGRLRELEDRLRTDPGGRHTPAE
ncbi:MAG TPA: tetratricopeptide repeat protein [Bacteroidota bacterium]|nr:tetratricopeptide repeat protein [Bacteroidota bacterium]